MLEYIGTKIVQAEPKTGGIDSTKEGYFIKYPDGYASWCPKDIFEKTYQLSNGCFFGGMIEGLKQGLTGRRNSWDQSEWVSLVDNALTMNRPKPSGPNLVTSYVPTDADILADDWIIS